MEQMERVWNRKQDILGDELEFIQTFISDDLEF
jgi:hypothetical protein